MLCSSLENEKGGDQGGRNGQMSTRAGGERVATLKTFPCRQFCLQFPKNVPQRSKQHAESACVGVDLPKASLRRNFTPRRLDGQGRRAGTQVLEAPSVVRTKKERQQRGQRARYQELGAFRRAGGRVLRLKRPRARARGRGRQWTAHPSSSPRAQRRSTWPRPTTMPEDCREHRSR